MAARSAPRPGPGIMLTHGEMVDDELIDAGDTGGPHSAKRIDKVRASEPIKFVLQTITQHAAEAFHKKLKPLSDVLGRLDLSNITWKSNAGDVIEALLRAAGFGWSRCGKKVWRRADKNECIEWRQPARPNSLKPAAPRATALGGLAAVDLQHDSENESTARAHVQRKCEQVHLACPCCCVVASAVLPDGITGLQCSGCEARFYAMLDPPKPTDEELQARGGRTRASHHALPMNRQHIRRPATEYNLFQQAQAAARKERRKAAGADASPQKHSREVLAEAAAQWTAQKAAAEAAANGAAADTDGDAAGADARADDFSEVVHSEQQARPRPRSKREPEAVVQEPLCPKGHPLVMQKVSASRGVGFECEGPVGREDSEAQCSHVFAQNDWKHGCRPCDYDLCAKCVVSAWPAPAKRSRP